MAKRWSNQEFWNNFTFNQQVVIYMIRIFIDAVRSGALQILFVCQSLVVRSTVLLPRKNWFSGANTVGFWWTQCGLYPCSPWWLFNFEKFCCKKETMGGRLPAITSTSKKVGQVDLHKLLALLGFQNLGLKKVICVENMKAAGAEKTSNENSFCLSSQLGFFHSLPNSSTMMLPTGFQKVCLFFFSCLASSNLSVLVG